MKKISILSLLLFFCVTGNLFAQSKNVIKINLWSPIVATANLAYERAITEKVSVQLGGAYTTVGSSGIKYRGYQVQPEVRFYLSEKAAPAGFYVAPFARYRSLSVAVETDELDSNGMPTGNTVEDKATWSSVGGGVVVGAQWLFGNEHVAFGIFGGPAFYSHSWKYEGSSGEDDFGSVKGAGGFSFRSGVTLGVAF